MGADFIEAPFTISVDVSVSTFACTGHGPHRCFAVVCPGDVCYFRGKRGILYSFPLCGRCGALAIRELRQFVRQALLARTTGDAPKCLCDPNTNPSGNHVDCPIHGAPERSIAT